MSWFNRKKNPYDTTTDDYLRSTDTVGRPLAIVFIVLMVFVIAAVVFSLFLGGKWLYNNLDGKSTPNSGVITEQPSSETKPSAVDTPSSTNTSNTNTTNSGTTTSGSSQTTTSNTTTSSTVTAAPQQTPTTLPNTGPEPE